MNPRRRANILQAHDLRCQGLTLRQIADQMGCAHSTVSSYLRDFNDDPIDFVQTLATDHLVQSLNVRRQSDPVLHEDHISAARELRLLLDALDRITDRQQRRHRRDHVNKEADDLKYLDALQNLIDLFHIAGTPLIDPDNLDPDAFPFTFFRRFFSEADLSKFLAVASQEHALQAPKSTPSPFRDPINHSALHTPAPSLPALSGQDPQNQTAPSRREPEEEPNEPYLEESEQTRPNPNNTDHDHEDFPAFHSTSGAEDQESPLPSEQLRPIGPQFPASWHNPYGYISRPTGGRQRVDLSPFDR